MILSCFTTDFLDMLMKMLAVLAFALAGGFVLAATAACQAGPPAPTPAPQLPSPTAAATAAVAPMPTATNVEPPATALPPTRPVTPAAAAPPTPRVETILTRTSTPIPTPTSTPQPAPTSSGPSLTDVPPTDGIVPTAVMPNRDHFPSAYRIADIIPDGYSTVPPTSGPHWGAWSKCGFYNHPLPDELLVHNLEHGNIIVSYNLDSAADISALRDAVTAIPLAEEFAIVRRYPAIPEGMVALSVWGALDRMMGVDGERIARFFAAYPGNAGPEFANGLPCTTGIDLIQSSGG